MNKTKYQISDEIQYIKIAGRSERFLLFMDEE